MNRKDDYSVGDVLCDMHDGFEGIPKNLRVVSFITVGNVNAARTLCALTNDVHPGNKYLTIVGENTKHYVAAYSYDNQIFGLVELELFEP